MSGVSIYNAVAAIEVEVASTLAAVKSFTELPDNIETANLPLRLLEIIGSRSQAQNINYATLGATPRQNVDWIISDLLLYKEVAQGTGLKEWAEDLISYCDAYIDALQTTEALLSTVSIQHYEIQPGMYEKPLNSGRFYFGALAVMTMIERRR